MKYCIIQLVLLLNIVANAQKQLVFSLKSHGGGGTLIMLQAPDPNNWIKK